MFERKSPALIDEKQLVPMAQVTARQAACWNLRSLGLKTPFSTAEQVIASLVAVQAQDIVAAGQALALRSVAACSPADLLAEGGSAVRLWSIRGTLHLVPEKEAAYHVAATADDWFSRWGRYVNKYLPLPRAEMEEKVYPRIADVLSDEPLSYGEIMVAAGLDDSLRRPLRHIMHDLCYLGLCVRAAEDGVKARYSRAAYPRVPGLTPHAARLWLTERFIAAYGPVTLRDIVYWTGFRVPTVSALLAELLPKLAVVAMAEQETMAFIKEEQLPLLLTMPMDEDLPRHHLPAFDVLLLGYRDKTRFLSAQDTSKVFLSAARVAPVVLEDGRVAGTWRRGPGGFEVERFDLQSEQCKG